MFRHPKAWTTLWTTQDPGAGGQNSTVIDGRGFSTLILKITEAVNTAATVVLQYSTNGTDFYAASLDTGAAITIAVDNTTKFQIIPVSGQQYMRLNLTGNGASVTLQYSANYAEG